ncbi:hypothetical protein HMPREF1136_1970 [Actinomyces sp. ICM47]|nr:hypothetical protein HMPREF1136_1970 [Actinomyces sp. ICM47]
MSAAVSALDRRARMGGCGLVAESSATTAIAQPTASRAQHCVRDAGCVPVHRDAMIDRSIPSGR